MILYPIYIRSYRKEQQQEQPVARIELQDPRHHAEGNQYEHVNPHYVRVHPQQPNPDNISVASEEDGGGEAGDGSETREACEAGEARGEEHLNPHYYNRLKHSINWQNEREQPITKVIGMNDNN